MLREGFLKKKKKQAGAELGQAQLKLELSLTSIKIRCIKLMTRLTHKFEENSVWLN